MKRLLTMLRECEMNIAKDGTLTVKSGKTELQDELNSRELQLLEPLGICHEWTTMAKVIDAVWGEKRTLEEKEGVTGAREICQVRGHIICICARLILPTLTPEERGSLWCYTIIDDCSDNTQQEDRAEAASVPTDTDLGFYLEDLIHALEFNDNRLEIP